MRELLIVLALLTAGKAWSAGLAAAARLNVGAEQLVVGQTANAGLLDCKASAVQHTIKRCALKPALAATASSVGRRIKSAAVTLNFQDTVINMSLEFDAGLGADLLTGDYAAAIGSAPKTQYWADDDHLYASSIWIDGETEVEISRTVKGASDGAARAFVSRLAGNPLLSPDDAR